MQKMEDNFRDSAVDEDKTNKKFAWREEMKGREKEWQTFDEIKSIKSSDSIQNHKHIDDYNKSIDDILSQIKAKQDNKLKDIFAPSIKKTARADEMRDLEKEVKMLQEKNNLRRSYMTDKHEKVQSVKLEIRPQYSDHSKTLERKNRNIYDENIEHQVKKGAWRKDMARYEEDLELSKLRNETEKKIYNLDKETTKYSDENVKQILRSTIAEQKKKQFEDVKSRECKKPVLIENCTKNDFKLSDTTTSVTIKLREKEAECLDAALTIKPFYRENECKTKDERHIQVKEKDRSLSGGETIGNKEMKEETKSPSKQSERKKKPLETSIKEDHDEKCSALNQKNEKRKGDNNSKEMNESHQTQTRETTVGMKPDQASANESQVNTIEDKEESLEEEDEDVSGMKAMRKETNDAFANMEAEFEAGRTKLAALRARIRKAREMSQVVIDE